MDESDLKCSICLEFFKPPVRMTNCGHNYCHNCLNDIAVSTGWNCPECRTPQGSMKQSQLARNFFLERSVEKFHEMSKIDFSNCLLHNIPKKLRKFLTHQTETLNSLRMFDTRSNYLPRMRLSKYLQ